MKRYADGPLLDKWVTEVNPSKPTKYQLLWRGSKDGYEASTFHSKCNGKGPTVTVILSNNDRIFGGYTSVSWGYNGTNSSGKYQYDATAFIYSLTHKAKCATQRNQKYSIQDWHVCGPTFGGGFDIVVFDNCNTHSDNYCQTNSGSSSYQLPPGAENTFLAGSYNFTVKEIEVYKVIKEQ